MVLFQYISCNKDKLTKEKEDELTMQIKTIIDDMVSNNELVLKDGHYYMHSNDILTMTPDGVYIYRGEPSYYEIVIRDKIIKLNLDEVLTSSVFRKKYFSIFNTMPKPVKAEEWAEVITMWVRNGITKQTEEINDESEVVDDVLRYIKRCRITDKIERCIDNRTIFYDGNGSVYVPNEIIRNIILSSSSKTSLRKVSFLLKDYLLSGSKKITVNDIQKRWWNFSSGKISIDKTMIMSDDDE
jgi:hypothetical protein